MQNPIPRGLFSHRISSIAIIPVLFILLKMLLRLSGADILNADLIHVSSGRIKYRVFTHASYIQGKDNVIVDVASRHTFVQDISGRHVAEIEWTGKDKKCGGLIRLDKNDPIKVLELFGGCETVTTLFVLALFLCFSMPDYCIQPRPTLNTNPHWTYLGSNSRLSFCE